MEFRKTEHFSGSVPDNLELETNFLVELPDLTNFYNLPDDKLSLFSSIKTSKQKLSFKV